MKLQSAISEHTLQMWDSEYSKHLASQEGIEVSREMRPGHRAHPLELGPGWEVGGTIMVAGEQGSNPMQNECQPDASGMILAAQGAYTKTPSSLLWSPFCCSMPQVKAFSQKAFRIGDSTMPGRQEQIGDPYHGRPESKKEKWQLGPQQERWKSILNSAAPSMGRDGVTVLNQGAHMIGARSLQDSSKIQQEMLCEIVRASNGTNILWATQTFIHQSRDHDATNLITDERAQALHELQLQKWGRHFDLGEICGAGIGRGEWIDMHMLGAAVPDFYRSDSVHVNQTLHFTEVRNLLAFAANSMLAMPF